MIEMQINVTLRRNGGSAFDYKEIKVRDDDVESAARVLADLLAMSCLLELEQEEKQEKETQDDQPK